MIDLIGGTHPGLGGSGWHEVMTKGATPQSRRMKIDLQIG